MKYLLKNNQKPVIHYLIFVLLITIILLIYNPNPIVFKDVWAEDGREYLGKTIQLGFWEALHQNFLVKGYLQFFKFAVGGLAIAINQFLFGNTIIYLPAIVALISYLCYAFIFSLPILLFCSSIRSNHLSLLAILSCFISIGSFDRYVAFGRILNIGFLSIYFCFLLVGYRLLNEYKINWKFNFILDLFIILCVFTQPINIVFLAVIYIKKIYQLILNQKTIRECNNLFLITVSISFYGTLIIANNLLIQSYAGSGLNKTFEFLLKPFFGRMMFNNWLAILYPDLPYLLPFFLFIGYLVLIAKNSSQLHWYSIYSIICVAFITAIWRPGILNLLGNMSGGIYAMPTLLINLFLTISLLDKITKNKTKKLINYGIWLFFILVFLANAIHTNYPIRVETISIERSLELAQPHSTGENNLYKVPINPEGWFMLLPKEYIKHD